MFLVGGVAGVREQGFPVVALPTEPVDMLTEPLIALNGFSCNRAVHAVACGADIFQQRHGELLVVSVATWGLKEGSQLGTALEHFRCGRCLAGIAEGYIWALDVLHEHLHPVWGNGRPSSDRPELAAPWRTGEPAQRCGPASRRSGRSETGKRVDQEIFLLSATA